MPKRDGDSRFVRFKVHAIDGPRPLQRQELHEDIDVTHGKKFLVLMLMNILEMTHWKPGRTKI
jgi:hypothetical protein